MVESGGSVFWWEKNDDSSERLVKFIHSKCPSPSLDWIQKGSICWVEMKSFLKVLTNHRQQVQGISTSFMKRSRRVYLNC
jgi:hypothetical protein